MLVAADLAERHSHPASRAISCKNSSSGLRKGNRRTGAILDRHEREEATFPSPIHPGGIMFLQSLVAAVAAAIVAIFGGLSDVSIKHDIDLLAH